MLRGTLDVLLRPRVTIAVRGPWGLRYVEPIIDTAFDGALSLPLGEVQRLGLPRHGVKAQQVADARVGPAPTFWGDVDWLGQWIGLEIIGSNLDVPLIGAELLRGHELLVNYGPARSVEIR